MYNFLNSWFDKKGLPILRVAFVVCLTIPLENGRGNFTQGILLQKITTTFVIGIMRTC